MGGGAGFLGGCWSVNETARFPQLQRPAPYTNARDLRKQAGAPVCACVLDYMESEDSDEEPEDPDDSAPSLTRGAVTALALAALPWVLAAGRFLLPVTSVAAGCLKGLVYHFSYASCSSSERCWCCSTLLVALELELQGMLLPPPPPPPWASARVPAPA